MRYTTHKHGHAGAPSAGRPKVGEIAAAVVPAPPQPDEIDRGFALMSDRAAAARKACTPERVR